jgi:hypothetical protein
MEPVNKLDASNQMSFFGAQSAPNKHNNSITEQAISR